jgi:hypothetical protein
VLHKIDADSGKILEIYNRRPIPIRMACASAMTTRTLRCRAGEGRTPSPGTAPQFICRFPLNKT